VGAGGGERGRETEGERFQYRQRNSSYDEPRVIFFRLPPPHRAVIPLSPSLPSVLSPFPPALPGFARQSQCAFLHLRFGPFSASSLQRAAASSSDSFASLNLSHLPI